MLPWERLQAIPKFAVWVCNRNQTMQWRSPEKLQRSSKLKMPSILMGRRSFSLISQESRNSTAFRTTGKRYEPPGCVAIESFRRSRSGGMANGRGAVCDRAVFRSKSLKNEKLKRRRLLFEPRKHFFGWAIFEFARIFGQFVSTLLMSESTLVRSPCRFTFIFPNWGLWKF